MSQIWLKPKKFSARSARNIVLYHTIKTIALTNNYCTQNIGCAIGVVWLHTWLGPNKRIFQLRCGIFIFRPYQCKRLLRHCGRRLAGSRCRQFTCLSSSPSWHMLPCSPGGIRKSLQFPAT